MRAYWLPADIILSIGSASLTMAASTTGNGVIKSLNMQAHTITLADGTASVLTKGLMDLWLKVGESVAVVWDMTGNVHEASAVSVVKS